jgi:hypothetical protein
MTNESLTIASAHVSREQALNLVIDGLNSIRDGILAYHELELTLDDLYADLKAAGWSKSKRTLQRAQTDLRQEGLLPEHHNSRPGPRKTSAAKSGSEPVENSTPLPTVQPTPTTTNDHPHHPASAPQQQCVQADGWGDATVVTAEVVTMPDGELDYQRAIQLFDEIIALSKRNFASGWTELQWNELGGYCRTFEGCCNARGRRNGSVAKKPVPSAPAFEPCLN